MSNRMTWAQIDEYSRLKAERSALDVALANLTSLEAAVRVLRKHDLLSEWAKEIASISPPSGDTK